MSATFAADARSFEDIVTGEIRAEIARQRLNYRKVADRMGRTNFWVGDRLNGRCHIEVQDLAEFANVLGVDVTHFVRHQGLEPRTRWFRVSPSQRTNVIPLPTRPKPADAGDGPAAEIVSITDRRSRVNNKPDCFKQQPSPRNSVPNARRERRA